MCTGSVWKKSAFVSDTIKPGKYCSTYGGSGKKKSTNNIESMAKCRSVDPEKFKFHLLRCWQLISNLSSFENPDQIKEVNKPPNFNTSVSVY